MLMLENTMDDDGNIVRPVHSSLRTRAALVVEHDLKTRPVHTEKWMGHFGRVQAKSTRNFNVIMAVTPK
jgi:hypothetical protein